jgi:glutaminase
MFGRTSFLKYIVVFSVLFFTFESLCFAVPGADDLKETVNSAYNKFKNDKSGKNADYIPELAKVPSELFGIAIVTVNGDVYTAGDVDYTFSIQSVSKPFTVGLVMQQQGEQIIIDKVGVEPTGLPFNSVMAVELLTTRSGNPLVNPGAIATVSLVAAKNGEERFHKILDFFNHLSGSTLSVMEDVYQSETSTNFRNRAFGHLLHVYDRIYSELMSAVDVYTRQCAIGVSARQLAVMGATLANNGVNPVTKIHVIDKPYVSKMLAVMMMAGFYNESGKWAWDTGLPAKTGVGGGIVAVVPGQMAIVGFSPRLNEAGNSVRAAKAINDIVKKLGLNLFEHGQ